MFFLHKKFREKKKNGINEFGDRNNTFQELPVVLQFLTLEISFLGTSYHALHMPRLSVGYCGHTTLGANLRIIVTLGSAVRSPVTHTADKICFHSRNTFSSWPDIQKFQVSRQSLWKFEGVFTWQEEQLHTKQWRCTKRRQHWSSSLVLKFIRCATK